jgi:tRNA (guanine37-N1)-methyltransferase
MRFDVLTIFPDLFGSFLRQSLIGKALASGLFSVNLTDIREFTADSHRTVDDRPFGGGPGMVLKIEPLHAALEGIGAAEPTPGCRRILLTPAGQRLDQAKVGRLAEQDRLVLICGRYEGVDHRLTEFIDEEISVGDYVLSGGEVPAMIVIEAVSRLIPGVLGKAESAEEETFRQGLVEYPHYTRPRDFKGLVVPEVLLSGDHQTISRWRRRQALLRTVDRRPDLIEALSLSAEEKDFLARSSQKDGMD